MDKTKLIFEIRWINGYYEGVLFSPDGKRILCYTEMKKSKTSVINNVNMVINSIRNENLFEIEVRKTYAKQKI
jgi:hypothetical protein